MWSIIASRHTPDRNAQRVTHYNKPEYLAEWKYNVDDFENNKGMPISKIIHFEKKNNVTIHIYGVDDDEKTQIPIYKSKQTNDEVINLFYFNKHYSLIKNWKRFCGDRNYVCPNCLWGFAKLEARDNHIAICKQLNENGSLVKLPKNKIIKKDGKEISIKPQTFFNDYKKQKITRCYLR